MKINRRHGRNENRHFYHRRHRYHYGQYQGGRKINESGFDPVTGKCGHINENLFYYKILPWSSTNEHDGTKQDQHPTDQIECEAH